MGNSKKPTALWLVVVVVAGLPWIRLARAEDCPSCTFAFPQAWTVYAQGAGMEVLANGLSVELRVEPAPGSVPFTTAELDSEAERMRAELADRGLRTGTPVAHVIRTVPGEPAVLIEAFEKGNDGAQILRLIRRCGTLITAQTVSRNPTDPQGSIAETLASVSSGVRYRDDACLRYNNDAALSLDDEVAAGSKHRSREGTHAPRKVAKPNTNAPGKADAQAKESEQQSGWSIWTWILVSAAGLGFTGLLLQLLQRPKSDGVLRPVALTWKKSMEEGGRGNGLPSSGKANGWKAMGFDTTPRNVPDEPRPNGGPRAVSFELTGTSSGVGRGAGEPVGGSLPEAGPESLIDAVGSLVREYGVDGAGPGLVGDQLLPPPLEALLQNQNGACYGHGLFCLLGVERRGLDLLTTNSHQALRVVLGDRWVFGNTAFGDLFVLAADGHVEVWFRDGRQEIMAGSIQSFLVGLASAELRERIFDPTRVMQFWPHFTLMRVGEVFADPGNPPVPGEGGAGPRCVPLLEALPVSVVGTLPIRPQPFVDTITTAEVERTGPTVGGESVDREQASDSGSEPPVAPQTGSLLPAAPDAVPVVHSEDPGASPQAVSTGSAPVHPVAAGLRGAHSMPATPSAPLPTPSGPRGPRPVPSGRSTTTSRLTLAVKAHPSNRAASLRLAAGQNGNPAQTASNRSLTSASQARARRASQAAAETNQGPAQTRPPEEPEKQATASASEDYEADTHPVETPLFPSEESGEK
jgi:hypothetical protein